jgi:hypothetical protein
MKYLKTYEGKKPPFKTDIANKMSKLKNVPFKTFDTKSLRDDCRQYDVQFDKLINELLPDKFISFECFQFYDNNLQDIDQPAGAKLGECKYVIDVRPDIIVKFKGEDFWCLLKKKVRIYNYVEGTLMEELETKKMADKYNL